MADEDDAQALRLAYELQVLALAREALTLGGRPTVDDLERVGHIQDLVKMVEVSLVTALIEDGVSWQRMATARGETSRQSLNYRLSKASLRWRKDHVPESADGVSVPPETFLLEQHRKVRQQVAAIGRRHTDLQSAVRGGVRGFLARALGDEEQHDDG